VGSKERMGLSDFFER